MILNFEKLTRALSICLDYAEKELLDIRPYHGSRVAVLAHEMGRAAGLDAETLYALTEASLLHDCALDEYLHDELPKDGKKVLEMDMALHCEAGERMLLKLPFYRRIEGTVLYHHERADRKGAFGTSPDEIPLTARILHLADCVDFHFNLYDHCDDSAVSLIRDTMEKNIGRYGDEYVTNLFLKIATRELFDSIEGEKAVASAEKMIGSRYVDLPMTMLIDISSVFAHITDYKSNFTCRHSTGIAEKARRMGEYYKFDTETCDKLYVAGALHDVGKIMVGNDILEKPDRLTNDEYAKIQNHAVGTHTLLDPIEGFEEIAHWASNHHEKLDGSGYPLKLTSEKLDRNDRLLACLDIYQALVEDRPYKSGFPHEKAIAILADMALKGQLDGMIVADIDKCFGN